MGLDRNNREWNWHVSNSGGRIKSIVKVWWLNGSSFYVLFIHLQRFYKFNSILQSWTSVIVKTQNVGQEISWLGPSLGWQGHPPRIIQRRHQSVTDERQTDVSLLAPTGDQGEGMSVCVSVRVSLWHSSNKGSESFLEGVLQGGTQKRVEKKQELSLKA